MYNPLQERMRFIVGRSGSMGEVHASTHGIGKANIYGASDKDIHGEYERAGGVGRR